MGKFPKVIDLADFRKPGYGPKPGETLEMLKSYMQIKDPRQREAVAAFIEKIVAGQSQ